MICITTGVSHTRTSTAQQQQEKDSRVLHGAPRRLLRARGRLTHACALDRTRRAAAGPRVTGSFCKQLVACTNVLGSGLRQAGRRTMEKNDGSHVGVERERPPWIWTTTCRRRRASAAHLRRPRSRPRHCRTCSRTRSVRCGCLRRLIAHGRCASRPRWSRTSRAAARASAAASSMCTSRRAAASPTASRPCRPRPIAYVTALTPGKGTGDL